MTLTPWVWFGSLLVVLAAIFLRRWQNGRLRERERFATIFDFLPEDYHAKVYRALEIEHVEGEMERARRASRLGGEHLLRLIRLGYKAETVLEARASKRSEVSHDRAKPKWSDGEWRPFEPGDPGYVKRPDGPAQPGSDDRP